MTAVRVAIVHDYLTQRGGAERVVLSLMRMFPGADLYTSVYDPDGTYPEFRSFDVRTTWLQRLPHRGRWVRALLPLYPRAFDGLRLAGYDLVISSSSGFAHRVVVPDGRHVCYCYTPPRFLHRTETYLDEGAPGPRWLRPALGRALGAMVAGDVAAAQRPDVYVGISQDVVERIGATYGRAAEVVHPPVDVGRILRHDGTRVGEEPYYLVVSRLLPYKKVDAAIRAAQLHGARLVVVGSGPAERHLRRLAGPEVEFRSDVDERELNRLLHGCTALIQPGHEDFGLAPLEANAAGRPVIAYNAGGARETVIDGVTGLHIEHQAPQAIAEAMERTEAIGWDTDKLRAHADSFGEQRFHDELRDLLVLVGAHPHPEQKRIDDVAVVRTR